MFTINKWREELNTEEKMEIRNHKWMKFYISLAKWNWHVSETNKSTFISELLISNRWPTSVSHMYAHDMILTVEFWQNKPVSSFFGKKGLTKIKVRDWAKNYPTSWMQQSSTTCRTIKFDKVLLFLPLMIIWFSIFDFKVWGKISIFYRF